MTNLFKLYNIYLLCLIIYKIFYVQNVLNFNKTYKYIIIFYIKHSKIFI